MKNRIIITIKDRVPNIANFIEQNIEALIAQLPSYKNCDTLEKPYAQNEKIAISVLISLATVGIVGFLSFMLFKLMLFIAPYVASAGAAISSAMMPIVIGVSIAGLVVYMVNPNIIKAIISKIKGRSNIATHAINIDDTYYPNLEVANFTPDQLAAGVYMIVSATCYAIYSVLKMSSFITLFTYIIINIYYIHAAHLSISMIPALIKYVVTHWNTALATVIHAGTAVTTTAGVSIIFALSILTLTIINKIISSNTKPIAPTTAQLTNDVKRKFQ